MRPSVLAAALMAMTLAVSGCGGDDDGDDAATTAAPATTASGGTDTTAGTTETTAAATVTTTAGDDDDAQRLQQLLDESGDAVYYAEYTVTDENGDTSTFVVAQDPPNRLIGSLDSPTVVIGDKAYQCEVAGGTRSCQELPAQVADSLTSGAALGILGLGPVLAKEGAGSNAFASVTDETIAGRSARCYEFDASKLPGVGGDTENFTYCIDRETAVTLRMLLGDQTVEATLVRAPTADDFAVG